MGFEIDHIDITIFAKHSGLYRGMLRNNISQGTGFITPDVSFNQIKRWVNGQSFVPVESTYIWLNPDGTNGCNFFFFFSSVIRIDKVFKLWNWSNFTVHFFFRKFATHKRCHKNGSTFWKKTFILEKQHEMLRLLATNTSLDVNYYVEKLQNI